MSLNPKSEYRNPKQCSNFQNSHYRNNRFGHLKIWKFVLVSKFGFRASDLTLNYFK
jgi:hypothetical protein